MSLYELASSERAVMFACGIAIVLAVVAGRWAPGPSSARGSDVVASASERPERIVSLSLPGDELLLALVDPRRIAALEEFVDDPHASNAVVEARRVAARASMTAESVFSLRPDLVLLPPWVDPTLERLLAQQAVPTFRLGTPESLDEVRGQIRALARRVGETAHAEALIRDMDRRLAAVREQVQDRPRPRAVLWSWSGYTPARGTLFAEVVALAGGSIATDSFGLIGYAPLPLERLLALDPEVIVRSRYRADARARDVVPEPALEEDRRFASIRAVRGHQVLDVPSAHLLATSHHVATLAEDLARLFHHAEARR